MRMILKFGGTSVADKERLCRAARRCAALAEQGHEVVVVVSAQGHTTDEMIEKARQVSDSPSAREMDAYLSAGEQMSACLMAMTLEAMGFSAVSLSGWQVGLETDGVHGNARVKGLGSDRIQRELKKGKIVVVAGFQGIDPEGDVTTLGRGGSDTTAVALAAYYLRVKEVRKIILTRPAVEAGERLGFLPGDMTEKLDPYLRPLYDALKEILGLDMYQKFSNRGVIEIAPLAYMRGRTLNDAFIILDEAQNTTSNQMKMFLTRLGFNSRMVVTGDLSQIDLPRGVKSGLAEAVEILKSVKGVGIAELNSADVVRHEVVSRIVDAYAKYEGTK